MSIVLITGSAGLIGSEASMFFCKKDFQVVGIDNDLRKTFFGQEASTKPNRMRLEAEFTNYVHHDLDIRDASAIENLFRQYGKQIDLIIHTAAQPSHDWAAKNPFVDFSVNANGTLILLENFRKYCPEAVFIFTSTNKVYGDRPNGLPLIENNTRYELPTDHPYYCGIDETMAIDACKHSLFGASKIAADILVQEYGKYFGLNTVSFRGGCLTGPAHAGTRLHGFLSYLMKCCVTDSKYFVYGYRGKQVRDNIHSFDLINAFWHFYQNPRSGEVYNIGGGRYSNCSMKEAIEMCQDITGKKLNYEYDDRNRSGDHKWWISDINKFRSHYPAWEPQHNLESILEEIYEAQRNGN